MSVYARGFNNKETRVFIDYFFSARQGAEGNQRIVTETLGEHASLYATFKNWVVHVKRGVFSTCDAPRPGRLKIVTTPKINRQIHDIIMEDRRISAKSIAEQLGISREQVGSITN